MSAKTRPRIVEVSPEMAALWLSKSRQKRLVKSRVAHYAALMESGRWDPDLHKSSPIVLSRNQLGNGNHRLRAVVMFGQPVQMWVQGQLTR